VNNGVTPSWARIDSRVPGTRSEGFLGGIVNPFKSTFVKTFSRLALRYLRSIPIIFFCIFRNNHFSTKALLLQLHK